MQTVIEWIASVSVAVALLGVLYYGPEILKLKLKAIRVKKEVQETSWVRKWTPVVGDPYFVVNLPDCNIYIREWRGYDFQFNELDLGLVFQSRKEAEIQLELLKEKLIEWKTGKRPFRTSQFSLKELDIMSAALVRYENSYEEPSHPRFQMNDITKLWDEFYNAWETESKDVKAHKS